MNFSNSFQKLPRFFYEDVTPTPIKNPKLIHISFLRDELKIALTDEELKLWLNGELKLPGEQRISSRYAGHQFGVWAGQLGDGRAISLGEISHGPQRFEVQTKGSGLTPFSRMGDGKAVIRSSVREYLCSLAMRGLGIPTTDVLALMNGDDEVYREKIERSGLVARVFPSNIRFGHFEMAYHYEKKAELNALIEYTQNQFYPGLSTEEMLQEIITRTAHLVAHWQSVGFCHGVMNTDNMSILGITIDYGPFGFLEDTILNHICNHSDHKGRYAHHRQPSVALWNLERLLVCFLDHVPRETLESMLRGYQAIFEERYVQLFRRKIGDNTLTKERIDELLMILHRNSIDFTFFFREFSKYEGNFEAMNVFWGYYGQMPEIRDWFARLGELTPSTERLQINPKYVLRNYIAQEVIEDVEADSNKRLNDWIEILSNPFEEHEEYSSYSMPTPSHLKSVIVSCSS